MVLFHLLLSTSNVFFIALMIYLCIFIFHFPIISTGNVGDVNLDSTRNFYQYEVEDIKGNVVNLRRYRGKASLVVNVASECGYTDQHYRDLVKLQAEIGLTDRFNVLAFPCNQFGTQEPGDASEIEKFVKRKYQVNFPFFAKINVIGDDVPEAWQVLTAEASEEPTWNFWKYLVGGDGHVVKAWGPGVSVGEIRHDILDTVETLTPPDLPYQPHHDHDHEEL